MNESGLTSIFASFGSIYTVKGNKIYKATSVRRDGDAYYKTHYTDLGSTSLKDIRTKDEIQELAESISFMEDDIVKYIYNIRTITADKERIGAELTVMKNGEHWFHTAEQMTFLDGWISGKAARDGIR